MEKHSNDEWVAAVNRTVARQRAAMGQYVVTEGGRQYLMQRGRTPAEEDYIVMVYVRVRPGKTMAMRDFLKKHAGEPWVENLCLFSAPER